VPGEENLDFIDSLRSSSIRLVLTRHEQAAGFMAATYGRLTGKPGVCLATLGPGATNLVTAAAYSQLGAMPMLMITGQKPIRKSKQGRFQIVDVVGMMQPITKYSQQIVDAKRIPSLVREAFRLAAEERPGAVHLELPEDIAAEQAESADGVIALDNGMYKIWFARNYRCGQHNSVLLDNALATMGAGLPGLIPAYTCQHADPAIRKHPDFQG
jgi:thiamine pyrophosphate-dependent acetolactate synthase large subunit-like protein